MHIDWLTVSAQIVNFVILVWLLQRFLYGPIVRAMDRREARIRARLDEAAQTRAQAAQAAQAYHERRAALEQQREQLLGEAREQAMRAGQAMMQHSREEVDAQHRQWQQQLQDQRAEFMRALRERATEQLITLARRALADLADVDLERQMAERFLARLDAIDASAKAHIRRAAERTQLRVRTHDPLAEPTRQRLTQALHVWLDQAPTLSFESDAHAPWGIELHVASHVIAWTLESYLDDYVATLGDALDSVAIRT